MTTLNKEILIHELNLFKESMIKRYDITDKDVLEDIEFIINEMIEFGCEIDFEIERYMMFDTEELLDFIDYYKEKKNQELSLDKLIKITDMLFEEDLSQLNIKQ